jgi:hypothetical protein
VLAGQANVRKTLRAGERKKINLGILQSDGSWIKLDKVEIARFFNHWENLRQHNP